MTQIHKYFCDWCGQNMKMPHLENESYFSKLDLCESCLKDIRKMLESMVKTRKQLRSKQLDA